VGEHLERAIAISSINTGGVYLNVLGLGCGGNCSFGGKKWSNGTFFICWEVSAPGREGKRDGVRLLANLLAVHRLWGVVPSRKDDQCVFLAAGGEVERPPRLGMRRGSGEWLVFF